MDDWGTSLIRSEAITVIDVDETLILWNYFEHEQKDTIAITCPYDDVRYSVLPNPGNIRLLIEHSARGHYIIVWSKGGYQWANAVLDALLIKDKVNLIMSKPTTVIDDLPASKWMPDPTYIERHDTWKHPKRRS
jgi:hypothetical protein